MKPEVRVNEVLEPTMQRFAATDHVKHNFQRPWIQEVCKPGPDHSQQSDRERLCVRPKEPTYSQPLSRGFLLESQEGLHVCLAKNQAITLPLLLVFPEERHKLAREAKAQAANHAPCSSNRGISGGCPVVRIPGVRNEGGAVHSYKAGKCWNCDTV